MSKSVCGTFKQEDIDDNCPLTGDDTDTEDVHQYLKNSNSKDLLKDTTTTSYPSNSQQQEKTSKSAVVALAEDEEESLSSDYNYFSDEETSSIAESYDDFGKEDSCTSEPTSEKKRQEKIKRIAIKEHLDQLGDLVVEKEYTVRQAREELQKCHGYLLSLQEELQKVADEINESEEINKNFLKSGLISKQDKLLEEFELEKKVEERAVQNLENAELRLAETYIEHAKFFPFDESMENAENISEEKLKSEKVAGRIKKEMTNLVMSERRKRNRDKENVSNVRERERRNRQAVIAAKKNREIALMYLKDTMSQVRQRESEEEDKSRNDLSQRMNALLSLKKNIELNKENITSLQTKNKHTRAKEDLAEQKEREMLLSTGENPDEILTKRKRIRQLERDKEAFERKQREREIEIVNKIALEEKQVKRRYQQQPELWLENRPRRMLRRRPKPRCDPSSGSESMEYSADVEDIEGLLHKFSTDEEGEFSPYGATNRDDDDEQQTTEDDCNDGEELYAQPDFNNLWEESFDEHPEDKLSIWKIRNKEGAKLGHEMVVSKSMSQLESGTEKQAAVGLEFKGCSFVSKPSVVVFKDYDVGTTYEKKVLLTNISYSQTYCQFIGISDSLKDFVIVNFIPPGQLSAGLTCEIHVKFQPKVNKDITGAIEMMSQSGLFYIPVKCLIKQCKVEVDVKKLKFEKQVIGESVKKSFILKNTGALGIHFKFSKLDEELDETVSTRSTVDAIRAGKISNGVLDGFSSIALDVIFSPSKAGLYECKFSIEFSKEDIKSIQLSVIACAIELPVNALKETIDLKVCMFDRLYQDAVIISNRATSALRVRFEIPKEVKNHVDILPKTAYVQAESQFSAQLKFLPRKSLTTDAEEFFNKEDGLLEVPIIIRVADQAQPVSFVVKAVVTSSDFEFSMDEINFGYCSVYETVFQRIQLYNKSVLPQQYGFISLPETVYVQPNDGFGTILPNEKINIYVYFNPTRAKEYRFNLVCKSQIGREFTIRCKGIGVIPPLKISNSLIRFKATAVNDSSTTQIHLINDHLNTNQFIQPDVPRIGSGDIFPVGPVAFQFAIPENAPICISPAVGTVNPGEKCIVHVIFSPKLNTEELQDKVLECRKDHEKMKIEETKPDMVESKDLKTKKMNINKLNNTTKPTLPSHVITDIANSKISDQYYYNKAKIILQRTFENRVDSYTIPCFVTFSEFNDMKNLDDQDTDIYNTLSLEVHCPSVKPSLIVVSDKGANLVDFGKVPLGRKHFQVISIQNISVEDIVLKSSLLDPVGPFELVNALRMIKPGVIHSLKLSFTPQNNIKFYEVLQIYSRNTTVQLHLKGEGIRPQLLVEPPGETFDVGDALVMDTIYQPLKITNSSELSMVFDLTFGSLSTCSYRRMNSHSCSSFNENCETGNENYNCLGVGCVNRSGMCVFGCEPSHGTLEPGESREIIISFSPDSSSEYFHDKLEIDVDGIKKCMCLNLLARSWPSLVFIQGWDRLSRSKGNFSNDKQGLTDKTVLLTLYSSLDGSSFLPATRSIEVGCIKSTNQTRKSCDFAFENTKDAIEKGFVIEPMKGGVDIGSRRQLIFKWNPAQKCDPQHFVNANVQLAVRGDVSTTYSILLRGCIRTKI